MSTRRKTKEEFLEELFKKNPTFKDKYSYEKFEYINNRTKSDVYCKSCEDYFSITPNAHSSQGQECRVCSYINRGLKQRKYSIKELEEVLKNSFPVGYKFDCSNYLSNHSKIDIFCPISKETKPQWVSSILNGYKCSCCSLTRRKTLSEFVLEARNIHKDLYDYSLVEYKNSHTKVNIVCKEHGVFLMKPSSHIHLSQGCPECSPVGYNPSKRGTIYVTAWSRGGENTFIKYGITNLPTKVRTTRQKCYTEYKPTTLFEFTFENGRIPLYIENRLKEVVGGRYIEKSKFEDGYTETVSFNNLPLIMETIKEHLNE